MENNTVSKAYDYLYQGILSGKFPLGSPISEVQIGNKIGVSRSPIREALKQMASEGLVKQYPGRGTFVTEITLQDLEEIFELRILLELFSLRKAYRWLDKDTLEDLEHLMLNLNEKSSEQEYYDANLKFHSTIISYCNNKRVKLFYQMLSSQLAIVYSISAWTPSHDIMSKNHHLEIIQALKDKDIDLAVERLRFHLEKTRENTINAYNNQYLSISDKK